MENQIIAKICAGGQTGVDRGALDAARASCVPIVGWVPRGGWAEDASAAPGVLTVYSELQETPSPNPEERTRWNVRDSHVTIVLFPSSGIRSVGTVLTVRAAKHYGRPYKVLTEFSARSAGEIDRWLSTVGSGLTVNVAGPRESEMPGAYSLSRKFVASLLRKSG